jgi:hypothetical protein
MDEIDTEEARDRYNSGEYATQRALTEQVNKVEGYRKQLSETGLSKTSQNYVIEALMGSKEALGLMSQEELEQYLKTQYNGIDTNKLIEAAKEGHNQFANKLLPAIGPEADINK